MTDRPEDRTNLEYPGSWLDLTYQERTLYHGIRAAMKLANDQAHAAGWYTDLKTGEPIQRNFGEVIALMHSELSECLEAHRKNLMDDKLPHRRGTEVELADLLIRVFDTAAQENMDLEKAVIEKLRYNRQREDHKIENRKGEHGKKY